MKKGNKHLEIIKKNNTSMTPGFNKRKFTQSWHPFTELIFLLFVLIIPFFAQGQSLTLESTRLKRTTLRTGPSTQYDRLAELPMGLDVKVISTQGNWSKVYLSRTFSGWIKTNSLQPLPQNTPYPVLILKKIKITREPDDIRIDIYESGPGLIIPYEWRHPKILWLTFYHAKSEMEGIYYSPKDPLIQDVQVRQISSHVVSVKIDLSHLYGFHIFQKNAHQFLIKFQLPPPFRLKNGKANLRQSLYSPLKGWRICLDPGHGGKDTGAIGPTGLEEKTVTLKTAEILGKMLQNKGAAVIYTRTTDRELTNPNGPAAQELQARVNVGKKHHADLFISIHFNSKPTLAKARKARGTFVYYYQPQSLGFAWDICRNLENETLEPKYGVVFKSLYVVRELDFPAVLVEACYISNPITEARLRHYHYLKKIAYGICKGILQYVKTHKLKS
jgi:N-acetylmuramoyl-L-alanine amidase